MLEKGYPTRFASAGAGRLFRICGRSGLEGILRADAAGVEAELGVFPDASASGLVQEALLPQMRPVRRGGGRPWAPGQCVPSGGGQAVDLYRFRYPPRGNSLFLRIFAAVLRATGENFIFRMVLFAGSNVIVSYGPKTI